MGYSIQMQCENLTSKSSVPPLAPYELKRNLLPAGKTVSLVVAPKGARSVDLTNLKFGRLYVIGIAGKVVNDSGYSRFIWTCVCSCGNFTHADGRGLRNGKTLSCGCFQAERAAFYHFKHGEASRHRTTIEYKRWSAMKTRCLYPSQPAYKHYGGRGIKICTRWLESFDNFLQDMGRCPDGFTLERKDTNGNYEPRNCVWADQDTQSNNRRNNRILSMNGQSKTVCQWAKFIGVRPQLICDRINKLGWDTERALTEPNHAKRNL